jgi:competence ComEA-like helix-hairpin-helix protein
MKTAKFNISPTYIFLTVFFSVLIFGLYTSGCGRKQADPGPAQESRPKPAQNAININTASAEELAKLPQIGERFAKKIVEYRETYGPFRRPEHLMLVEGINDKKFRLIKDLVKTE